MTASEYKKMNMDQVMQDLFRVNKVPSNMAIPLFYGTVYFDNDTPKVRFMRTISGFPVIKSSFEDCVLEIVVRHEEITENENIIFTIVKKRLSGNVQLFDTGRVFRFAEFNISENAESEEIVDAIKRRWESIETQLNDIEKSKEMLHNSIEEISSSQTEYSNKIENLQRTLDSSVSLVERVDAIDERINAAKTALYELYSESDSTKPLEELPSISSATDFEIFRKRLEYDYNPLDVQLFLIGLHTTQIIILCGKPGIGKTEFTKQMALALGAKYHLIEVQSSWTDRSDLLGYFNPTNGEYQSTDFLDALFSARQEMVEAKKQNRNARLHIICLDEMNIARVEYYFAIFLSLLQRSTDERKIRLIPGDKNRLLIDAIQKRERGEELKDDEKDILKLEKYQNFDLPTNVRFVATMNIDESTNPLSPKVIDRSLFIELKNNASNTVDYNNPRMEEYCKYYGASQFIPGEILPRLIDRTLRTEIKNEQGIKETLATPRLLNYAKHMWDSYAKYNDITDDMDPDRSKISDSERRYIDTLILSKVLPSITKKSRFSSLWGKLAGEGTLSHMRFEKYIQEHKNDRFVSDGDMWSYWE